MVMFVIFLKNSMKIKRFPKRLEQNMTNDCNAQ
jgi:hypothetical protein